MLDCIIAGVIVGIIYFFFTIVFSAMVFSDMPQNLEAFGAKEIHFTVANGVGIHCLAIMIGCLVFTRLSSCKAVIAGPDLLPIIFAQEASRAIEGAIKDPVLVEAQLLPTTLVAMIIGNIVTGCLFWTVGKLRKTSMAVGRIPKSVVSGFLSCIG